MKNPTSAASEVLDHSAPLKDHQVVNSCLLAVTGLQ